MAKLSKKQKALQGVVDSTRLYSVAEALELLKKHTVSGRLLKYAAGSRTWLVSVQR